MDRCVRDTKRAAGMLVRFSYISLSWMSFTSLPGWQWWSLDDPRWLWTMETARPGQWSDSFLGGLEFCLSRLTFPFGLIIGCLFAFITNCALNCSWTQVSAGYSCAKAGQPGIYHRWSNSSQIFWILSFENSIILSFEYFILSFTPVFPSRLAETLPWLKSIVDWCCSVQPVFLELWSTELYLCRTLFEM